MNLATRLKAIADDALAVINANKEVQIEEAKRYAAVEMYPRLLQSAEKQANAGEVYLEYPLYYGNTFSTFQKTVADTLAVILKYNGFTTKLKTKAHGEYLNIMTITVWWNNPTQEPTSDGKVVVTDLGTARE